MPGRSAGAPTGDADADSDCRGPRSGSAQRRTVTGGRRIRTTCRAARRAHLLVTPTRTRTAGVLAVARPSAALWPGPPDSDYMPGRAAGAPTGDADADPDCRRPRSGSAQRRTVTGAAGFGLHAGPLGGRTYW